MARITPDTEGAAYTARERMRKPRPARRAARALVLALLAASCGSTKITSSQTTFTSDELGADIPVRVTAAAVKPSTLHLYNGLQATFVNQDVVARTLVVDPVRSDQAGCAAVGLTLQPGEQRTTNPLPAFAACYFRDAERPEATAFQGVVVTH
jgi:hypothetical protein